MRRILLFCGGLFLGLVAEIILWNSPVWYTNEESKISPALTQMAGVAVIVEGALIALAAALCLGRALVPLALAPAVPGSAPAPVGGGPVLPICGLLFLLAAFGPLGQSRYAAKEYEFAQGHLDRIQDWYVELSRRIIGVGRTLASLGFVLGGALLGSPLFLKSRVWQLRRRLNRAGCRIALGGLALSVVGILLWLVNSVGNAMGGGRNSSHDLSYVGYLGILAGALLAVAGSIVAATGKAEAGKRPAPWSGD